MQVTFLAVGKRHDPAIEPAISDYMRRLQKYCKVVWVFVPSPKANLTPQEQKHLETAALLKKIPATSTVVLLDERGKAHTTGELAAMLASYQQMGKDVVFVIGGAFGVSQALVDRASSTVSLSKLTFPHQLVRLILAEQLYRGFTVLAGEPYHHD